MAGKSPRNVDLLLKKLYYNRNSNAFYAGVGQLHEIAKSKNAKISKKQVDTWLRKQPAHNRHYPIRKTRKFDKIKSIGPFAVVQIDLADMHNQARDNRNFKYIFVMVCSFHRGVGNSTSRFLGLSLYEAHFRQANVH